MVTSEPDDDNPEIATDAPPGFLTKGDREYLRGERKEPYQSEQAEANKRQDIRDRTRRAIRDFQIVVNHMTEHDRRQVFHPERENTVESMPTVGAVPYEVLLGIRSALMFMYLGVTEQDADFSAVLGPAVRPAERGRGNYVSDFEFGVRTRPYDALKERLTDLSEADRETLGEAADVLQTVTEAEGSYEVRTLIESLTEMLEADSEPERVKFTEDDVADAADALRAFHERREDDGESEADGEDGPDAGAE